MTVREATVEDWPVVAALLAELGRPDVAGGEDEAAHRAAFAAYLARADATALVAELDGEIVGFCDLEFRQRLNFLEPQAWIPDLIVSPQARSRGAGAALLARARELAAARGCFSLSLESASWRTRAHAFYEREGMADTGKAFSVSLTGAQWPPAPRP